MFDELTRLGAWAPGTRDLNIADRGVRDAKAEIKARRAVDPLLEMTDTEVRKRVGECFAAQLRSASAVHGAFFAGSPPPPVPIPAGTSTHLIHDPNGNIIRGVDQNDIQWVDGVAVALVAWAMAHTAQHGFAACVDAAKAQAAVVAELTYSNSAFVGLARANYDALFPARTFHDCDPLGAARVGRQLAMTITSDAFINKEMLAFAANPAGFYQKIYRLLYQVLRLNPDELDGVKRRWTTVLEQKGLSFRWDIYQAMQADRFNEQTFLPEVQAVINAEKLIDVRIIGGGRGIVGQTYYTYEYGRAAADWLKRMRGTYHFFTVKEPTNVVGS
jgi:hypothetical protein